MSKFSSDDDPPSGEGDDPSAPDDAVAAVDAPKELRVPIARPGLEDPKLTTKLRAHARVVYRLKPQDAEDLVNSAVVRALRASRWASDASGAFAWMKALVFRTRLDQLRAERDRLAREVPLEKSAAVVDPRTESPTIELVERIKADAARNPKVATGLELFTALRIRREDVRVIAKRHRIGVAVVYKRSERFAARVRNLATNVTMAAAVGFALWLLIGHLRGFSPPTIATGPIAPNPNAELPTLAANETPAAIRARGLSDCDKKKYIPCLRLLNRARDKDPEGDQAPAVQAARTEAVKALRPDK